MIKLWIQTCEACNGKQSKKYMTYQYWSMDKSQKRRCILLGLSFFITNLLVITLNFKTFTHQGQWAVIIVKHQIKKKEVNFIRLLKQNEEYQTTSFVSMLELESVIYTNLHYKIVAKLWPKTSLYLPYLYMQLEIES